MAALASHPELYDALREAGASEPRARAAEQATLPAGQAATKAEVDEKVTAEIRPAERDIAYVKSAVNILAAFAIANFFFAVGALIFAHNAADIASANTKAITQNATAIAENRVAIEANAKAIGEVRQIAEANAKAIGEVRQIAEANAKAIAENRIAIEANAKAIAENRAAILANSEKLDQIARNQAEILRLLRTASAE